MENKEIKSELFWIRSKDNFQEIDFDKSSNRVESQNEIPHQDDEWRNRNYRNCPNYGYTGWDWDVIKEFEHKSNLSDSLLYGLGFAYSSYASNLLNNNTGFSDSTRWILSRKINLF